MAAKLPSLVIPQGQEAKVLQFYRAVTDRLETLSGARAASDRALLAEDLVKLKLIGQKADGTLTAGTALVTDINDLLDPASMEEYYKLAEVADDHELLLYDWREKRFRRLDFKLLGDLGIAFATREETDAGVIDDKALNPDVGAYAYDRKRWPAQHEAGKGTEVVAAFMVGDDDEIVAVASGGTTIRTPVRGIRHIGRDATGVTIMGVPDGEVVASVALILASDDDE